MTGDDLPVSATRHDPDRGSWERVWQRPSGGLRELFGGYVGYRQRMVAAATHRGIPGPNLPLVVSFGPSQTIALGSQPERTVVTTSFVAGVHDGHVMIDAEEHHGIQVDLSPVAANLLLGQPLAELTGAIVPLDAVLGPEASRLVDDLATAPSWSARFRQLDQVLVRRLGTARGLDPQLRRAWSLIAATRGQVPVGAVAAEIGWSPRRLRGRFTEEFGLAPKRMARLTRFSHAAALLARPDGPPLAEIAARAGYHDQAHLSNEVRAHSGLTPATLRASHLPDGGGVFESEGV